MQQTLPTAGTELRVGKELGTFLVLELDCDVWHTSNILTSYTASRRFKDSKCETGWTSGAMGHPVASICAIHVDGTGPYRSVVSQTIIAIIVLQSVTMVQAAQMTPPHNCVLGVPQTAAPVTMVATAMLHAVTLFTAPTSAVTLSSDTRTFSYTHKPGQGIKPNQTLTLADHTAASKGQHVVLISWFTGSLPWLGFGDLVISYYIDGEATPSISASINLLTGFQGSNTTQPEWSKLTPWGNAEIGRAAATGGAYTTIKIPFSQRVLVTAEMAPYETEGKSVYSLIRGLENYGPITLKYSNLELPPNSRLRGRATEVTLDPIEWATLAAVEGCGPGTVLFVAQHVSSQNAFMLEGIHEAELWGGEDGNSTLQVSSGFEDYYLSGQVSQRPQMGLVCQVEIRVVCPWTL